MNFGLYSLVTCFAADLPCLKEMKNGGFVPKDSADVTTTTAADGTKKLIVKSKTPTDETPTFASFNVAPGDVKEIKYTPLDKDGKPTGETKTFIVTDPALPIDVVFDDPITADQLQIELVPATPGTPTTADLVSLIACMPEPGKPSFQLYF